MKKSKLTFSKNVDEKVSLEKPNNIISFFLDSATPQAS